MKTFIALLVSFGVLVLSPVAASAHRASVPTIDRIVVSCSSDPLADLGSVSISVRNWTGSLVIENAANPIVGNYVYQSNWSPMIFFTKRHQLIWDTPGRGTGKLSLGVLGRATNGAGFLGGDVHYANGTYLIHRVRSGPYEAFNGPHSFTVGCP